MSRQRVYRSLNEGIIAERRERAIELMEEFAAKIEAGALSLDDRAHGFTLREIETAYRELAPLLEKRPTRLDVASKLGTSEATVKRAQKALGRPGWPPL